MGAGEATAAFVAIVGLLAWQAFAYWKNRRPQVRLSLPKIQTHRISGTFSIPDHQDPRREVLFVTLTNAGPVTFTVDAFSVERPMPDRARFVRMEPEGDDSLAPGEAREYSLSMSSIEDDETNRTQPVRFRVVLASGDVFVTDDVPLMWPLSNPPEAPRLKRD